MQPADAKPPFTYNLTEFISGEVDVDPDRIAVFPNEEAARAAGLQPGDVFRTADGHFGVVGVIPFDGRE